MQTIYEALVGNAANKCAKHFALREKDIGKSATGF